jgi:hypothetical protein
MTEAVVALFLSFFACYHIGQLRLRVSKLEQQLRDKAQP